MNGAMQLTFTAALWFAGQMFTANKVSCCLIGAQLVDVTC